MDQSRRAFLVGGLALLPVGPALAQTGHGDHGPLYERLQYAPMLTPRHGLGAAAAGDAIYVAGGGPVMGGGVQSAVHEAFTLA